MDEWTGEDGRVDVAAIMAGIREKIRGRRDLGLYTDEEVEELSALRLQAFADDAGIDPDLLSRLMADNHYGWFQRVEKGIYDLTDAGRAAAGAP